MQLNKIEAALDQVYKQRELLGDHTSTVGRIKRPPGMKRYIWLNKVAHIRKNEKLAKKLLSKGLKDWSNSRQ